MPGGTIRRAAQCRCDCGTVITVEIGNLKRELTRSCGCLSREKSAERRHAGVRHVIRPGDRFGRLTVIREVRTCASDGRATRSALCCCDCGNESTPTVGSLISGDARSCGCSRGRPQYKRKRCPVCGEISHDPADRRACSRSCGYRLMSATRQSANPSDGVLHHRFKKTRDRPAITPALTAAVLPRTGRRSILLAMTSGPDSSPDAGNATAAMTVLSAKGIPGRS